MTWTVKYKHTRPNTDVEFYSEEPDSPMNYFDTAQVVSDYKDTGKLISTSMSLSENGLELIKTLVYKDEASKLAYSADSRILAWKAACDTYNTSNNISKDTILYEET